MKFAYHSTFKVGCQARIQLYANKSKNGLVITAWSTPDPPENCHLNVKNCQKLSFFPKKIAGNFLEDQLGAHQSS